ncbi:hypothetical protein JCM5350_007109, partial [Sporobolomyces pararoseus]
GVGMNMNMFGMNPFGGMAGMNGMNGMGGMFGPMNPAAFGVGGGAGFDMTQFGGGAAGMDFSNQMAQFGIMPNNQQQQQQGGSGQGKRTRTDGQ